MVEESVMVNAQAAFDRHGTAHLQDTGPDDVGLELYRRWRDPNPIYDLTMFWRDDDTTLQLTRAELEALGHALVRLANEPFPGPSP
jgi:hypothetical protein